MKKRYLVGLACGAVMFGVVGVALATPVQWTVASGGNGHYYEVVSSIVTWDTAKANAQASTYNGMTGYLATIISAEENSFILNYLNISAPTWLGGFQPDGSPEPDGNWQWITGEAWSYSNWDLTEPNNSGASVTWMGPENNLIFYASGLWNDGHGWNANPGLPNYLVEYNCAIRFIWTVNPKLAGHFFE